MPFHNNVFFVVVVVVRLPNKNWRHSLMIFMYNCTFVHFVLCCNVMTFCAMNCSRVMQ